MVYEQAQRDETKNTEAVVRLSDNLSPGTGEAINQQLNDFLSEEERFFSERLDQRMRDPNKDIDEGRIATSPTKADLKKLCDK